MKEFEFNERLDTIYSRYLESFKKTKDTKDDTGKIVFDFYLDYVYKALKDDLRTCKREIDKYYIFNQKMLNLRAKRDNLESSLKTDIVIVKGFFKLYEYDITSKEGSKTVKSIKRKLYRLDRKKDKLINKYHLVIPKDIKQQYINKLYN